MFGITHRERQDVFIIPGIVLGRDGRDQNDTGVGDGPELGLDSSSAAGPGDHAFPVAEARVKVQIVSMQLHHIHTAQDIAQLQGGILNLTNPGELFSHTHPFKSGLMVNFFHEIRCGLYPYMQAPGNGR